MLTEIVKRTRIDWHKMKTKFLTGNYKSLRDFAKKQRLSYNGNFREKTKGWTIEKGAKEEQIRSNFMEKFIEKEVEKAMELNDKIQKISGLALDAAEEFLINKDYQRYIVHERKAKRDQNGNLILDKAGKMILANTIDIVEAPFIQINKVMQAMEIINKAAKIINHLTPANG